MEPVDPKYLAGVARRLDDLLESAPVKPYDPATDRIVVFSDHHRGVGDGADDFRRCERAYTAALGFYLQAGYRLLLLGDTEELWEVTRPAKIFARYEHVLGLERRFTQGAGLVRFWGNHDDRWASAGAVRRELRKVIGDAPVHEGLRLEVHRPGAEPATIFFAHGHQGTPESDRFSWLARLPVRFIWALFQRLQGAFTTTPAQDHMLRARHDRAMFEWARAHPNRVLIAGHTHRPVFAGSKPDPPPTRPIRELEAALAKAQQGGDARAAARVAAELEFAQTLQRRPDTAVTVTPPCYFNTGCCSFPDGDVTGIELADGEIRLVRWPANLDELRPDGSDELDPERRIIPRARERLDTILDLVARPADVAIEEQPIAP
jgi:UDP-2,3-diacylglucosamine pyrophosphatase LpxH